MTEVVAPTRPDGLTIFGIVACALPVAAFSSYSQFMTARQAGMPAQLAWVLPMATDATAFVATRVWLSAQYSRRVRRYGAFIALSCMALSFIAAAIHLAVSTLAMGLRLAIGGLPSLSLAALVHLAALLAADRGKTSVKPATRRSRGATRPGGAESSSLRPSAPPGPTVTPSPLDIPPNGSASVGGAVIDLDTSKGAVRHQMLAHLDQHPDTTGAELDRLFNTTDYGRGVVRTWKRHRLQASGE